MLELSSVMSSGGVNTIAKGEVMPSDDVIGAQRT